MNGVRTRKPPARLLNGDPQHMLNGNGKVHLPAGDRNDAAETENIFLFYPNLIGLYSQRLHDALSAGLMPSPRILSYRPRNRISLLHAPAPSDMLAPLQHLLPPGRTRRGRGTAIRAIDQIRSRARHGHGSMHHSLSTGIPEFCMAEMVAFIPRPHQSRSGEPLHAHVRDPDHGWIGPKSQED